MTTENKAALDVFYKAYEQHCFAMESLTIAERNCYQEGFSKEGLELANIHSQAAAASIVMKKTMEAILQSLTAPAVDVEGLKKGLRHYLVGGTPAYNQQVRGWNDCIDYLAARGYFGNVKEK